MYRSPFLLCIALIFQCTAFSQVTIDVFTQDESPIDGASILVQEINSGKENIYLTNRQGSVTVMEKEPFSYVIHHVGYVSRSDTVYSTQPISVNLNESILSLKDVVVTGQFESQSARNSVYKVRSITSDRIEAQGATNIQEVLSNELNIRFSRDNATGVSGLGLQGLGGQYVKVLIDGVPIAGKTGTGNEMDLGQVNVATVDRIELVEGPMAVNYGADALAGVINIITKKDQQDHLVLDVQVHEETVGSEYSLFENGIHAPSMNLSVRPAQKWNVGLNSRINRFGGWSGHQDQRNKSWYPKTQYLNGGIIQFSNDHFKVYYRLDQLDEKIYNHGPINASSSLKDEYAIDTVFHATRWMHQLQGETAFGDVKLTSAFSFSEYERLSESHRTILVTEDELNQKRLNDVFYKSFFTRQTCVDLVRSDWLSSQVGLDGNLEQIGGSTLNTGDKSILDLGLFVSTELRLDKLKVRPGLRLAYNSNYSTVPTPSVNLKYGINDQWTWRMGYGRGFRAPSARELYHEFIDSNHHILGNEDLKPEYSHNLNTDVTFALRASLLELNGSVFYNHVEDMITYFMSSGNSTVTTYINLDEYKTTGFIFTTSYTSSSLIINSGISFIGRYQNETEIPDSQVPAYVFTPEVNANFIYDISQTGLRVSAFYKFNGSRKSYQLVTNEEGTQTPQLHRIKAYHNLDLTLTKSWNSLFSITAGVKNLFNVTTLNNTGSSGGVHGGGGQYPVSYGRSFLVQLNYHLNKS